MRTASAKIRTISGKIKNISKTWGFTGA